MVVERDPAKVDFTRDGKIRLYPDDPVSKKTMREFRFKEKSKFYDPCSEASKMSMNCLARNNYNREPCREYFEVYRDCMQEFKNKR